MTELDAASLGSFLARFYDFYDSVVRSVRVDFEATPATCELIVEAQDSESASGWSRVVVLVRGCSRFRLEAGRTSFEVLSSGVQVGWIDGLAFVFLDAYPDDEGLPDLTTNRAFVAGKALSWDATPIE